jgi:ribosomal protein S12 methylthiotransferase
LGVFTYSIEPDTPAAKLDGHLPERIKKERRNRLMAIQQDNAFAWCNKQIGKRIPVLIDKAVQGADRAWLGRSYADAPDVDACVYVTELPEQPIRAGDLVECEIVSSKDYDLVGVALGTQPSSPKG